MEYFIWGSVIIFTVEALVKLVCAVHDKNAIRRRKKLVEDLKLMRSEIPYSDYVKIQNKASIRNTPIRSNGDFWDFILPFANCFNSGNLETKLAKADCEEIANE